MIDLALTLPDATTAWVGTYLVHSTLLLGSAWLAVKLWRRMPVRVQESLWRTALLGGVLTASAQVAIGWEPWSGRLDVPVREAEAPRLTTPLLEGEAALQPIRETAASAPRAPRDESLALYPVTPREEPKQAAAPDPLALLGGLWLVGLAWFLLRAGRARRGLRIRLAARRPIVHGALRTRLEALCTSARVRRPIRLTQTHGVGSPVALGILRPEIVVPARVADELSPAEQEVMLAHELAHHVRRDPLWLAIARAVGSLLFFQPLNLLARRRLRETSELLCDAWAAERTGRARDLAACLAKVAGWMMHEPRTLAVPAMAAEGSMLERRVARLLDAGERSPGTSGLRLGRMVAVLPLVAVAVFAPVVASGAVPTAASAPEMAADTAPLPDITPVTEVERALARLDEEIAGLETDLDVLLDLLRQVPNAPEALRRGAARLETRLAALEERRVALARDAKESTR